MRVWDIPTGRNEPLSQTNKNLLGLFTDKKDRKLILILLLLDHFPLLVELEMAPGSSPSNGLISRR